MSYCSLEEAWGVNDKCSRVKNQLNHKEKKVTFNIENKNKCNTEEHFMNTSNSVDLNNQVCDNYYSFETNQNYSNNNNNNNNQSSNNNCNNYLNPPLVLEKPILKSRNASDVEPMAYSSFDNDYELFNNNDSNQNANIMINDLDYNTDDIISTENNKVIEEVGEEAIEDLEEGVLEGFSNPSDTNSNLDRKVLLDIMDRLNAIEKQINSSNSTKNNMHDIILFIIIGIFVLFALDSIFRLGRLTV